MSSSFLVKEVTEHPKLGRGLFANKEIPKKTMIPYAPPIQKAIDGNVSCGMVCFGIFEYLLELAIGSSFHKYAANITLEKKDKGVDLFRFPSGQQRRISVSQLPNHWQTIFTADVLFPFQTTLMKAFGQEIQMDDRFQNHGVEWRNLLSSMDNVCFAPFVANGRMNEADACFVNSFKNFEGGDNFGKANAVFKRNSKTGEVVFQTTRVLKEGEQVFADYKYDGKDICNARWKEDAMKNILTSVKETYMCAYGYDMGREYWKCGLAFVWWLHDSHITVNEANLSEALDVLLLQSHPFVPDAFARRFLELLIPLYPKKVDTIQLVLARTESITRRAPRESAPDLHPDVLNLKVGDIICVFAYWNFDETTKQQIDDAAPLYCTVVVNYVWGQNKSRLINGLCIDNEFPEAYGTTMLLHGSNKLGKSHYLGHKIKFHGRKGNRKSKDALGRDCNNFFYREDCYKYNQTETHFPFRLCVEDDKKAPRNLAAISQIQRTIEALKPGDLLVSIETLVGWNGLQGSSSNPQKKNKQNPSGDGGTLHGNKTLKIQNENHVYTVSGRFEHGVPTGTMKVHLSIGNGATIQYEGTLGIRHPKQIYLKKGTATWTKRGKNVSICAEWKDDLPVGEVTIVTTNANNGKVMEEYKGFILVKNIAILYSYGFKKHGKGLWKTFKEDGRFMEITGNFFNNVSHGKVTKTYFNGDTYQGIVVNGYPHGHGKATTSDGVYVGEWRCGLRHGKGRLYTLSGAVNEGTFRCGKLKSMMTLQTCDKATAYVMVKKNTSTGKWGFKLKEKSNMVHIVAEGQTHVATVSAYAGPLPPGFSKEEFAKHPLQTLSTLIGIDDMAGARYLDCTSSSLDTITSFVASIQGTMRLRVVLNVAIKNQALNGGRKEPSVERKENVAKKRKQKGTEERMIHKKRKQGATTPANRIDILRAAAVGKKASIRNDTREGPVTSADEAMRRMKWRPAAKKVPPKKAKQEMHLCFSYKKKDTFFKVMYEKPFQKSMEYYLKHVLQVPEETWNSYVFQYKYAGITLKDTPKSVGIPVAETAETAARIEVHHIITID